MLFFVVLIATVIATCLVILEWPCAAPKRETVTEAFIAEKETDKHAQELSHVQSNK